jgi:hypothetical protein
MAVSWQFSGSFFGSFPGSFVFAALSHALAARPSRDTQRTKPVLKFRL